MPPGWLDQVSVQDVLLAIGGFVCVGLVVIGIVKVVHPVMVKVVRVLDLILGRPPQQGIPGKPSMMDRFDDLDKRMDGQDERLEAIEQQVTPNHGSTSRLSDDVQELKASLASLIQRFEDHLKPRN